MRKSLIAAIAALLLGASGCGGSDNADAPTTAPPSQAAPTSPVDSPGADGQSALRAAVKAYSDAYLTGAGTKAFDLLSQRCRDRMGKAEFTATVEAAKQEFGTALPFKSFDAEINGEQARVTYTYAVSSINQEQEPWVNEGGSWREDDC